MRAVAIVATLWIASQVGVAAQSSRTEDALRAGAFADAEAFARSGLASIEAAPRSNHSLELAHALDSVVAAATANGKAAETATLDLARRALQIKERIPNRDATDRAVTLDLLGRIHEQRGEFRTALRIHQRALSARQSAPHPDRSLIADSLDAMARTLLGLERWSEADRTIGRSLLTRTADSEQAPLALARTLELAARAKREVGRYRDAAADLDRALNLWNRFAPTHPDKAASLEVRGYVSFLLGDVTGSRVFWLEANALTSERLQPWHPHRARSARNLAIAEMALGNLPAARALREQGLAIAERAMAPCDPELAFQFNDVAISLQYDGEYAAADRMFRREFDTIRRCHGLTHSSAATAVYNQFALAREVGSYAEAQRLGELAVELWSRTLGPSHPFVAFGLNDLGDFFASQGNWSRARALFTQALRIRRRALGAQHPEVAWTLTGLARTRAQAGDIAGARALVVDAIDMLEKTPARDPDYLPAALTLRSALDARTGQYAAARDTLLSALDLRERSLGPRHALVASTRADLAATEFALGAYESAFRAALKAETDARELLRFSVRYMPEQRAMEYATARPRGLDVALSVVANADNGQPIDVAEALDAVIRSRGVILDEVAARARTLAAADPTLAAMTAAVAEARRRFSGMVLRSNAGQSENPAVIEQVRRQKEEAEAALAAESGALRTDLARANAGLAEIRQALPPGTALISFVRYNRSLAVSRAGRIELRNTPFYLAFVSRSDTSVVTAVSLGPAASLERLVAAWRESVGARAVLAGNDTLRTIQRYRDVATRVRRQIWDPLATGLAGVNRVFVVPDGALNLVSLAALPTASQSYLVEDGPTIHYLTTERDLIENLEAPTARGLFLVGGASYGTPPTASTFPAAGSGCSGDRALAFDYLPGSRAEVDAIAALWSSAAAEATRGEDFQVLSGSAARKSLVVRSAPGHRILHFATHGFFLADCGEASAANLRGVGGVVPRTPVRRDRNPLLLSGLALAGANAPSSRDNGLLTAEDVSALKLQGTEWAVLSACETGVGEVTSGEGVLGLRRAFQVAGVRTIILSLWPVQDRATRDWMIALYRARLLERQDTAESVRTASLTLLRDRRARGLSTHPFYWAAFAAAGDWR